LHEGLDMKVNPTRAAVAALPAMLLALAWAIPAVAQPGAEEWQRCRAVVAASERVACYDALVDRRAAPASAAPGVAPAAATPAAPAQASAEAQFGLPATAQSAQEITSSLPGFFPGWEPRARLRLANGQVWQVIDGSTAVLYLRDPVVKVRRAAFGSYMMEITGVNQAPRVRRVE
jgi:hypothetical protein